MLNLSIYIYIVTIFPVLHLKIHSFAEGSSRAKEGKIMSSPGVQLHIQDHYVNLIIYFLLLVGLFWPPYFVIIVPILSTISRARS